MHERPGSSALAAGLRRPRFGAAAQAVVGQPAPAFRAVDTSGKTVSLADYKGKHVVLEWVNPGCPFVQKHYNSGNMPATQKAATAKGVTWLGQLDRQGRRRLPAAERPGRAGCAARTARRPPP